VLGSGACQAREQSGFACAVLAEKNSAPSPSFSKKKPIAKRTYDACHPSYRIALKRVAGSYAEARGVRVRMCSFLDVSRTLIQIHSDLYPCSRHCPTICSMKICVQPRTAFTVRNARQAAYRLCSRNSPWSLRTLSSRISFSPARAFVRWFSARSEGRRRGGSAIRGRAECSNRSRQVRLATVRRQQQLLAIAKAMRNGCASSSWTSRPHQLADRETEILFGLNCAPQAKG